MKILWWFHEFLFFLKKIFVNCLWQNMICLWIRTGKKNIKNQKCFCFLMICLMKCWWFFMRILWFFDVFQWFAYGFLMICLWFYDFFEFERVRKIIKGSCFWFVMKILWLMAFYDFFLWKNAFIYVFFWFFMVLRAGPSRAQAVGPEILNFIMNSIINKS